MLLEERLDSSGSEGSWAWRDEHSSVNCPKAPDPAAPQPLPAQAEQDLNPDGVWQRFLLEWNDHETLREEAVSAEALLATPTLFPYVPRTRLGERPHADHLEAWLGARADQPYGRLQLTEEPLADGSAARTWRLTST
ncbi:hypothetical protein ACFY9H_31435 [Streptomyces bacillaris]|uniref:hypothetical protein n=1 Tax=Streptomyces bacillaris TaxID=68179 RepID=UPI0036E8B287